MSYYYEICDWNQSYCMYIHLYYVLQTALTLAWTLYSLGCNPEVQEKLRGEVQSVVGSDSTVTPEHIQRMPYIKDCIKETMRYRYI